MPQLQLLNPSHLEHMVSLGAQRATNPKAIAQACNMRMLEERLKM